MFYFWLLFYETRFPKLSIDGPNLRSHPVLIVHLEVDVCME